MSWEVLPESFRASVRIGPSCWQFTGVQNGNGYGRPTVEGRTVYAHRYVYERLVGPIPEGMVLDHLCDNRGCVRPEHLRVATQRENILRGTGTSARHARVTHCPRGHAYDLFNTYHRPGRPSRVCRTCARTVHGPARRRKQREEKVHG